MCGIVGYVGRQQARDVVVEGLRRLEYRGYDSAGIALVDPGGRRGDRLRQACRQAGQPGQGPGRAAVAAGDDGDRAHALGDPRPAHRRQRPPAPRRRPVGWRWCTTGSSRTSPGCAPSSSARASSSSPRPTPRSPPAPRARGARGLRPDHGDAAVSRRWRAPSRWSRWTRSTPRGWWPPAATHRWWSGSATARTSWGSDVAAFISHTREAMELGQDQVVTITRDGVEVTDFDGRPAQGTRYHVDWDLSAAEKDGYDWFMRKEIFEQPRAVADSLLGTTHRGRPAPARRGPALRRRPARDRPDRGDRLRHRQLRRAGGEVRDRALDPDPRARSSWPTSSATATRS